MASPANFGAVRVPGIGHDEGSKWEEVTVASREETTFEDIARVVYEEEEIGRPRAQERLLLERDQLPHERDQLPQTVDNAVINDPVVDPNGDVETGSKEVTRDVVNNMTDAFEGTKQVVDGEINQRRCGTTRVRILLAFCSILATMLSVVLPLVVTPQPDENKLECTQIGDGICRVDGYPGEDFHVALSCPTSASSFFDCSTCTIARNDNGDQCNSCTICAFDSVAYDCSNTAEGSCVKRDCNGNCVGSDDLAECSKMADGSRSCRWEDNPWPEFHVDLSCPAEGSFVSDCSTCTIVSDDNSYQCNSCTICADDSVAYDCSNAAEGNCVKRDCNGNCVDSDDLASTSPAPGPTDTPPADTPPEVPCSEMADGSLSCRVDDYPGEDFHIDYSCPASITTLSDCSSCTIIKDDNTDQCNSCTICGDTVAYDCSNIAEGSCVKKDCSANCEGSNP